MDPVSERLRARHPQRIDLSLERMRVLCAALGDPQHKLPPVVHVAGTNGKGSTCAMLESIALLANVSRLFADRCIEGLVAHEDRLRTLAESSPSIVTPLNSLIGYEEAAKVAKQALKEKKTIRQTVIDRGLIGEKLTLEELDRRLDVLAAVFADPATIVLPMRVMIAGFGVAEANGLFGVPKLLPGVDLRLRPPAEARADFLARHAELLAAGGLYARLWHRQSGGFLGEERAAAE